MLCKTYTVFYALHQRLDPSRCANVMDVWAADQAPFFILWYMCNVNGFAVLLESNVKKLLFRCFYFGGNLVQKFRSETVLGMEERYLELKFQRNLCIKKHLKIITAFRWGRQWYSYGNWKKRKAIIKPANNNRTHPFTQYYCLK